MKTSLVGYTGFVGSNLASQHHFDALYNSKNIDDAFSTSHELVIYSGVRAEKFLANNAPAEDLAAIEKAKSNIERLRPRRLVLISTVDVYPSPRGVFESTPIQTEGMQAYGLHRLQLEQWVKENIKDHCIVRLPALFGENLKKNFLFDMIQIVPAMLRTEVWEELCKSSPAIGRSYISAGNGFYKLAPLDPPEFLRLRAFFAGHTFNAMKFTDSRNRYQFYNLRHLYHHIQLALQQGIPLVNLAVAPIAAGEIYRRIFGSPFENLGKLEPVQYDMRTEYAEMLGGVGGYLQGSEEILTEIHDFVKAGISRLESGLVVR